MCLFDQTWAELLWSSNKHHPYLTLDIEALSVLSGIHRQVLLTHAGVTRELLIQMLRRTRADWDTPVQTLVLKCLYLIVLDQHNNNKPDVVLDTYRRSLVIYCPSLTLLILNHDKIVPRAWQCTNLIDLYTVWEFWYACCHLFFVTFPLPGL